MAESHHIRPGNRPVILSMPHVGTGLPERFSAGLLSADRALEDTDWWIDQVYGFTRELDITIIAARQSRTIIDLNRDPGGLSLYPGQATTELCPTTTFDGNALYVEGGAPDSREIAARKAAVWDPYHTTLASEIARLRTSHADVVVYDCHSIRSHVPRLFDGELPVFNIGTNGGTSCAPRIERTIAAACASSGLGHVVNGRFRGGYITRHYGRPEAGVHAIQMELAQRSYMQEPGGPFDAARARPLVATLQLVISAILDWLEKPRE